MQPLVLASNPSITARATDIALPAIAQFAELRERIDGDLSVEIVANELTNLSSLNADVVVTSAAVALRKATFNQLRTDVRIRDGNVAAKLNALGFGGQVDLQANAKIADLTTLDKEAFQQLSAIPVNAIASVTDVDLQELWPIVGQQRQLRPLRGSFSASFERGDAERQRGTIATGSASIRNMRWDNVLWSNKIARGVGCWRQTCRIARSHWTICRWPYQRPRTSLLRSIKQWLLRAVRVPYLITESVGSGRSPWPNCERSA